MKATAGPWNDWFDPVGRRNGPRNNWHLDALVLIDANQSPIMFFNCADADAVWQIGWLQLNDSLTYMIRRFAFPLITEPENPGSADRQITFASSLTNDGIGGR